MEFIIIGAIMNFYAWTNIDFFVTKKMNDRKYQCEWVDKGWGKARKENPNLSFFVSNFFLSETLPVTHKFFCDLCSFIILSQVDFGSSPQLMTPCVVSVCFGLIAKAISSQSQKVSYFCISFFISY